MSIFWIAISVYFIIALFFVAMTSIEGAKRSDGWDVHRLTGLSLCLVWPALILFIFIIDRPKCEGTTYRRR